MAAPKEAPRESLRVKFFIFSNTTQAIEMSLLVRGYYVVRITGNRFDKDGKVCYNKRFSLLFSR